MRLLGAKGIAHTKHLTFYKCHHPALPRGGPHPQICIAPSPRYNRRPRSKPAPQGRQPHVYQDTNIGTVFFLNFDYIQFNFNVAEEELDEAASNASFGIQTIPIHAKEEQDARSSMVEVAVDQIQLVFRTMHRLDCPAVSLLRNLREMLRQADQLFSDGIPLAARI